MTSGECYENKWFYMEIYREDGGNGITFVHMLYINWFSYLSWHWNEHPRYTLANNQITEYC
jgi:hypothetical protein